MAIMGYMGYRKSTGFMAGLTVAQISEFSIVFVAMGVTLGHVGDDALGLVTLIGLVTISICTYMVLNAQPIYERLKPLLLRFERKIPFREQISSNIDKIDSEIIIIGLGRYGGQLAQRLHKEGVRILGVDFDPERVRELRRHGLRVAFCDVESRAGGHAALG